MDMSYNEALARRIGASGRVVARLVIDRQQLRDAIRDCLAVIDNPHSTEQDSMRAFSRLEAAYKQSLSSDPQDDAALAAPHDAEGTTK